MHASYRIGIDYEWNPDVTKHAAQVRLEFPFDDREPRHSLPKVFHSRQKVMGEKLDKDWGFGQDDGDRYYYQCQTIDMEAADFPTLHALVEAEVASIQSKLNAIVLKKHPTATVRTYCNWGRATHFIID